MIDQDNAPATTAVDLSTEALTAALHEDAERDRATAQVLRDYLASRGAAEPA